MNFCFEGGVFYFIELWEINLNFVMNFDDTIYEFFYDFNNTSGTILESKILSNFDDFGVVFVSLDCPKFFFA